MTPVGLGFRALRGGSVVVAIASGASHREPRLVLSSFVATAIEGDRLSLEPYHVAVEMALGPDGRATGEAAALVVEGRRRQADAAARGMDALIAKLRQLECEPVIAALLVNRAGWMTDLLAYSIAFPDHPPVAEGLAVRDALRSAFDQVGLERAELDEKVLPERASQDLGMSSSELDAALKVLGATAGRPWRKEQKLASLAAWVTITSREQRAPPSA